MLRMAGHLRGFSIRANDGDIGRVEQLYFDDESWVVRYLVVDTGQWLPGRQVLVSPIAIGRPDWPGRRLPVNLTMDQVRDSPDVDTQRPVSRQREMEYAAYYGYPPYWMGPGLWGMASSPGELALLPPLSPTIPREPGALGAPDTRLRSTGEVAGYHLQARDGELGHVDDFLVDDETWAIRYIVIDTSNWWGGRCVLVPPPWIRQIDWLDAKVKVDLTREAVRGSPPFDASKPVDRAYEAALHRHYGRPGYWSEP